MFFDPCIVIKDFIYSLLKSTADGISISIASERLILQINISHIVLENRACTQLIGNVFVLKYSIKGTNTNIKY